MLTLSKIAFLKKKALAVRKNIITMLVPQESHHIGCSLSIVDILTTLYFYILRINPKKPDHPDRDIFILSKGHAGAALYATLAERGFFKKSLLKSYDRNGGVLPEHVTKVVAGVELSTGSLGHGMSVGIGFALAGIHNSSKKKIFVLISDGELNEGSTWESIMFAGHHQLSNLVVIIDYNKMQGYGMTHEVLDLNPLGEKIASFQWNIYEEDGHNHAGLAGVFERIALCRDNKPHFVIAHTIKGKGIPFFEGKFESHYKSINEATQKEILRTL